MVSTVLKYKAAHKTPYIEHRKLFHEQIGLVTKRSLAIILKIRSKLTPFCFAILEDSNLPPRYRDKGTICFMDFNLTDEETVYVTTLKVLSRRAKEKDFNHVGKGRDVGYSIWRHPSLRNWRRPWRTWLLLYIVQCMCIIYVWLYIDSVCTFNLIVSNRLYFFEYT